MNSSNLGNDSRDSFMKWKQLYGCSNTDVIILTILSMFIAIPGSIINGIMIACILYTRSLRKKTTAILLLNLAIGDCLVSVAYEPLYILLMQEYISGVLNMTISLGFALQLASLIGMLCLTFDRFIFICYPFRYVEWMTEKRAYGMIAATWLIATTGSSVPAFPLVFAYSFIFIVIAFFVMLGLQTAIFMTARRHGIKISKQFTDLGQNMPYKHRPTKGVSMVMGAFLLCWLPIMVAPSTQSNRWIIYAVCFSSLNSLVNPIICCWQMKDVKKALRKMFGWKNSGNDSK